MEFSYTAFFIVIMSFLHWRSSKRFQILQESLFLVCMATDRLEKELGTSKEAVEEVNKYLEEKLGPDASRVSLENYESSLHKKIEILLAAQADIHRGVAKISRPANWLDGYLITKPYDEFEIERDNDEDSPWNEEINDLAGTDLDGSLYLRSNHKYD